MLVALLAAALAGVVRPRTELAAAKVVGPDRVNCLAIGCRPDPVEQEQEVEELLAIVILRGVGEAAHAAHDGARMRILRSRVLVDLGELLGVQARTVRVPRIGGTVGVIDSSVAQADCRQVALEVGRRLRGHGDRSEQAVPVIREPVGVVLHFLDAGAGRRTDLLLIRRGVGLAVLPPPQVARARIQRDRVVDRTRPVDFNQPVVFGLGQVVVAGRDIPFVAVVARRRHDVADGAGRRTDPVGIALGAYLGNDVLVLHAHLREDVFVDGLGAHLRGARLLIFPLGALLLVDVLLRVLLADVLEDLDLFPVGADLHRPVGHLFALVVVAVPCLGRRVGLLHDGAHSLRLGLILFLDARPVDEPGRLLLPVDAFRQVVHLALEDILGLSADVAEYRHGVVLHTRLLGAGLLVLVLDALLTDLIHGLDAGRELLADRRRVREEIGRLNAIARQRRIDCCSLRIGHWLLPAPGGGIPAPAV